jgi:hypothetical protein
MSIFAEYGGRSSYYTANELDRLQNPEKYNYTQEQYDAFSSQVQKKFDARQAADDASQDAIPFSYVGRGSGSTNPAFSFAGYSGHTSGGTAGNVNLGGLAGIFGGGSTTETTGGSSSETEDGPARGPGGPGGPGEGETQHRADGGVIYPVQHMEAGGMIASPYANPMKQQMGTTMQTMEQPLPQMSRGPEMGGVGGMFQNMQQQFGQQMRQMESSPLKVYGNYLNQTYTSPQAAEMQAKVTEFVDLVDQAERAHFGAEESFGYGKPPVPAQMPMMQNHRAVLPDMPMMQTQGPGSMGGGIASLPPAF